MPGRAEMTEEEFAQAMERAAAMANKAADVLSTIPAKLLNRNFTPAAKAARSKRLKQLLKQRRAKRRTAAKKQANQAARQAALAARQQAQAAKQQAAQLARQQKQQAAQLARQQKAANAARANAAKQHFAAARKVRQSAPFSRVGIAWNAFRRGKNLQTRMRGGKALGKAAFGRGALGAIAGGIGKAIPVVGTFIAGISKAVDWLDKMGDAQRRHIQELAQVSAAMKVIANQAKLQETLRGMRQGAAQSKSARRLMEATQRKKDAREDFDNWRENKLNNWSANWEDIKTAFWDVGNSLFGESQADKKKKLQEEDAATVREAQEMARRQDLTNEQLATLVEEMRIANREKAGKIPPFTAMVESMSLHSREAKRRLEDRANAARRGM